MGTGIAISFLDSGFEVVLLESTGEALEKGIRRIEQYFDRAHVKGKLDATQVSQRMRALQGTLDYQGLSNVDLAVEAVFEDMAVKRVVFERLDEVCKPGAILATNTSYLDVNAIAAFTDRPQDVVGLHFFSPAQTMRLVEIVQGSKTASEVIATAQEVAARLRKTSVVAGVCDGFIGNRMFTRYVAAAHDLVLAGASPAQVDSCLERFGMAMGPFRVGDLAGLDISYAGRKRRAQEAGRPFVPGLADKLVEAGRLGQKTGSGWYRYASGSREPLADAATEAFVEKSRKDAGVTAREISDMEIEQRCIFALVNEGARILGEGIARRASDIDLVYLNGYGFPRERGGPMFYADTVGLAHVQKALLEFAEHEHGDPSRWTPAPLLTSLTKSSAMFSRPAGRRAH
jgi:3-hydroxyacyl-CoA dehydrogenase